MNNLIKKLANLLPSEIAYAHCDIPCGIYDPKAAQTAAQTVLVMVQKLKALDSEPTLENRNSFVRMVQNKEKHAQICKDELLILWTDYFKVEHLAKFPDLHETFWQAAKLCSKNKQTIDEDLAKELVKAVDSIAEMFADSKK